MTQQPLPSKISQKEGLIVFLLLAPILFIDFSFGGGNANYLIFGSGVVVSLNCVSYRRYYCKRWFWLILAVTTSAHVIAIMLVSDASVIASVLYVPLFIIDYIINAFAFSWIGALWEERKV